MDLLLERVREAIEVSLDDGAEPVSLEFVGVQRVAVPARANCRGSRGTPSSIA
jgi:hypothetical protein